MYTIFIILEASASIKHTSWIKLNSKLIANLIDRLAQGLEVNLVVHVVLLQLQKSCLVLVVHHPPTISCCQGFKK